MLELKGHRTIGPHIAAMLAERVAHFGNGADLVVGHRVDDDRGAADAVAFIADFFIGHTGLIAGGLVDVVLDPVSRQVGGLGLVNGQAQARVLLHIAAALTCSHGDLPDRTRPDLAALLVLAAFSMLDIGPFGMTGHRILLLPGLQKSSPLFVNWTASLTLYAKRPATDGFQRAVRPPLAPASTRWRRPGANGRIELALATA